MRLTSDERKIVKAILAKENAHGGYGSRYERVMRVVSGTISHHVYEYVKVEILIDIILKLANKRL